MVQDVRHGFPENVFAPLPCTWQPSLR